MKHQITVRGIWQGPELDRDSILFLGRQTVFTIDGFSGELGQTTLVSDEDGIELLIGLGDAEGYSSDRVRKAGAAAGRRLVQQLSAGADPNTIFDVHLVFPTVRQQQVQGAANDPISEAAVHAFFMEGVQQGSYRFRMQSPEEFTSHSIITGERDAVSDAVALARDLVNLPPNFLTPTRFAEVIAEHLEPLGVRVTVRHQAELIDGGYGGLLAVGKGSANPPVLVELNIGEGTPEIAFVGKGVTFDSGGLSLKTAEELPTMKTDMGGAAAVVGLFAALPKIAKGRVFTAVLAIVENMPGSAATRPGDVIELRNGAILEIIDTDFEGRVILADALARAGEMNPTKIIDAATLTYAAVHALGEDTAALVSNNDELAQQVIFAGEQSGDPVWRMPLHEHLKPQLRSQIADYRNHPQVATARISSAALLLQEFVPANTPWAHIDMAGPVWRSTNTLWGEAGATGYGVRLLSCLVQGAE